ncbi:hypothetical protein [Helicobacter marmotae]|uniref:hypothetical protein n=1 Tax=Helicobacter marmotae TaxID=152490 RepID=UPI00131576B6|nr:hypothetical protein [Helicobacter marmotae]
MWGIYKGVRALVVCWTSRLCIAPAHTCTFKPLPLIEKEKRDSLTTLQVCHSKHCEESLKESLVAHRDSSGLKPLRMTNFATRKGNPHIINTCKEIYFVILREHEVRPKNLSYLLENRFQKHQKARLVIRLEIFRGCLVVSFYNPKHCLHK